MRGSINKAVIAAVCKPLIQGGRVQSSVKAVIALARIEGIDCGIRKIVRGMMLSRDPGGEGGVVLPFTSYLLPKKET